MRLPISIVDAFTRTRFGGNPAAVVLLSQWLDDAQMQAIAAENNLPETAFVMCEGKALYSIRWYSPVTEIAFCVHATLAAAHVIARLQQAAFPIVIRAIGRR